MDKRGIVSIAGAGLALGGFLYFRLTPGPEPSHQQSSSPYAPPGSCNGCHAGIAKSYQATGMARSFYAAEGAQVVEDYRTGNQLVHSA